MEEYDVVIVGGGPAGLSAAEVIARNGYRVVVLEAHGPNYEKPCGGIVSKNTFKQFNIPNYIADFESERFVVYESGKKEKEIRYPCYIVKRRKLNAFLAKKARDSGAIVRYYLKATNFRRYGSSVETITQTKEKFHSKFVVLACGIDTCLKKAGFILPNKLGLGIQYWASTKLQPSKEVQIHIDKQIVRNGYGYVIPRDKSTLTIGIGSVTDKHLHTKLRNFLKFLRRHSLIKIHKIFKKQVGISPLKLTSQVVKGNIMLCGSSAGALALGYFGGISNALRSGEICGEAIVHQLNGSESINRYYENIRNLKSIQFTKEYLKAKENLSHKFLLFFKNLPVLNYIWPRYTLCKWITKNWDTSVCKFLANSTF